LGEDQTTRGETDPEAKIRRKRSARGVNPGGTFRDYISLSTPIVVKADGRGTRVATPRPTEGGGSVVSAAGLRMVVQGAIRAGWGRFDLSIVG